MRFAAAKSDGTIVIYGQNWAKVPIERMYVILVELVCSKLSQKTEKVVTFEVVFSDNIEQIS